MPSASGVGPYGQAALNPTRLRAIMAQVVPVEGKGRTVSRGWPMQGIDAAGLAGSNSSLTFGALVEPLDLAYAQGKLQHLIATTLCVIAAARAERQAPPIHAARQQLAAIYGATRLRRRLERETSTI